MTDITNDETAEESFMDYWNAVDEALQRLYGIDTNTGGIPADEVAEAQEAGESPEEFAEHHGERYSLIPRSEWSGWR